MNKLEIDQFICFIESIAVNIFVWKTSVGKIISSKPQECGAKGN